MADCIFQVAHLPSFQYLFSVLLHVCHTALQFSDKELQALTHSHVPDACRAMTAYMPRIIFLSVSTSLFATLLYLCFKFSKP